jgi:UDP:flavonoid glycosyltransferase YjiC (YdhE family)
VRVLFTFSGGRGHFFPTVPFARAIRDQGHEVLYACQDGMVAAVVAEGLAAVPSGGATLRDPAARRPLVALERRGEQRALSNFSVDRAARERAGRLMALSREWQPDLVVRDEVDFAGAVVAESLGLPHAAVVVLAAGGFVRPEVVGVPLAVLRGEYGLEPDDVLGMLHRYLTIVPVPPSYRDPRDPLPCTAHYVRPAVLDNPSAADIGVPRHSPTVYFTLGTIFHQESGDLFQRVIAGLRKLPAAVVVTVGHEVDPAELGEQPDNVRVERFLPMTDVLARADVVVSHGGSGTVIGALAFGLPQVLLPIGADHPLNADRCQALGVAAVLDAVTSTSDDIGEAAAMVMEDPSYRAQAGLLQGEIASLPDARHGASLLEQLARSRTPILH